MSTLTNRIPGMPANFGSSFGYVRAPLASVAEEAFAWRKELRFKPARVDLGGGLVGNADSLLPLAPAPVFRDLFVGTIGNRWTAYFNANPYGGDPSGAVTVLGRRLSAPTVLVTSIPFRENYDRDDEPLGGVTFAFAEADPNMRARSIALVEGERSSSRYHFESHGAVQPWEDTGRYAARSKRDRFDPELLEKYCLALGIDVFNLDFYAGPSALIERTGFNDER